MNNEQDSWLQRVEELIQILEGSSISELELTEAGTEIVIRRATNMVMVPSPTLVPLQVQHSGMSGMPTLPISTAPKVDTSIAIPTPVTGVYYSAASPTSPPFVNIGDMVHVGQVIALVEAMKIFNEVQADASGRVTALVATNGEVVQKGDAILRVEPA